MPGSSLSQYPLDPGTGSSPSQAKRRDDNERGLPVIAAMQQHRLILSLGVAILITALLSLTIGSQPLPLLQALQESFGDKPGVYSLILTELRIPRTLVALLAGASLGLCGAVMQSLLRNPLASPGLVGSASGAALGAVITLYFGVAGL
ncbi:MAG: iron chelate uptake ABC transporter family permease subunit, partial [Candidatus Thiodiazotropha endolucinida]